jgi:glycosyltransferase involved in cell wall biosynthesis
LPKTVLSIVSTLRRCGPANVLEGIVRGYDPAYYQSVVATLSPNSGNSALRDFQSLGIRVVEMNLSRTASLLIGARRLRDMIHGLKIDLVHCHGFRAAILVGKCNLGIPVVSTIHSDLMTDYRLYYGKSVGTWMARQEYAALRKIDLRVAVSEEVAEAARPYGVSCEVIANGVDVNIYHPSVNASATTRLRERLGLPLGKVVVLHTGVLIGRKRPVEVISGFRSSKLSKTGLLVLAGEGSLRRACELAAGGTTNIIFLGQRQDIPDLLRASDVLISNSTSEGLPMALLEGCACGTHIIASDIASHCQIRGLFPQQVSIYRGHGPEAVAAALDAYNPENAAHSLHPTPAALDAISASRMSRAYQSAYDTLMHS